MDPYPPFYVTMKTDLGSEKLSYEKSQVDGQCPKHLSS